MNQYETVFILTPVLSDVQMKEAVEKFKFIEFNAEPAVVEKLEVNFRRDERVIRFLTIKQDKYAAEYAAKRRSLRQSKSEEA